MKVLLAVDGSGQAEKAFDWYISNVHKESNELVIVHAAPQPTLPTLRFTVEGASFPSDEIRNIMQQANKKVFALQNKYDLKCKEAKAKHKSFFQISEGKPGENIVSVAEKENCDAIVMGSRGLGSVKRTFLGSVSDFVIHHSKIPVVVCPKE